MNCLRQTALVLFLGIAMMQGHALAQSDEDTPGVPGIPPGRDVGKRTGIGEPPASQSKLLSKAFAAETTDQPFKLVEASISDIHAALQKGEITCESLILKYLTRIKTFGGQCTEYDKDGDGKQDYDFFMPSGKGIILGVVNARPNAKSVNAISSVNLRPANYKALGFAPPDGPGPRSETDLIDSDPNLPDALEVAIQLDREFSSTHKLRPLMCIPMVIKDQMETIDLRTTDGSLTQFKNDRPPNDGTLVAKLRAAGAIIIGKGNMDEYAVGNHRSSYGGGICNPYATDRDGGSSSTGSAAAVSANLAVCGIAEESGGSIQEPGSRQGLVAMTATRGLVSRFGSWPAELIRERYGPECRTVADAAKVLDVIRGFDPKDAITATQVGYTPSVSLDNFAHATNLKSKRIGIVREFMPKITVQDAESIRVFNEEVIPTLKAAGAELVESINPRDIANGWAVDDPTIPNMSIQDIVAEMVPTLEPSFANPSAVASPSTTTGLLPNGLRQVFDATVPALFPSGTDVIQKSVEMFYDKTKFPDIINLRKLANNGSGTLNQGRYGLDKMLARRGDARVKSVADLSIDFEDLNHNGNTGEHLSFFSLDANTGNPTQKARPGVTPTVGVPATASGSTLDSQGEANHLFRMQSIREIVARILAENNLDALVYPFSTLPPKILTGTTESIPWLTYDGRQIRGYNAFTDASGLPAIAVQAGFTKVVYDRTTRGSTEDLALNPPSVKRDVMLPFSIVFLSRPWSEPTLLEIASGYERARGSRTPPPDFNADAPPAPSGPLCVVFRCSTALPVDRTPTTDVATTEAKGTKVLINESVAAAAKPTRAGRMFAEVRGAIITGVAIANPNDSDATILFSLVDADGSGSAGILTVPAHGQISKFLDQEPFNTPAGFQGAFAFNSDQPVALTGLRGFTNERGEFLATRLPIIGAAEDAGSDALALPRFADGDGWSSEVILMNPTAGRMTGTLQFAGATVTIGKKTSGTFAYSIPAGASQKFETAGLNAVISSGLIRLIPAEGEAPVSLNIFSFKEHGITSITGTDPQVVTQ